MFDPITATQAQINRLVQGTTGKELLAIYNAMARQHNFPDHQPSRRFASIAKGQERTRKLIEAIKIMNPVKPAAKPTAPRPPADMAAIAVESWKRPDVAAARRTKNHVRVTGGEIQPVEFRSVYEAFVVLELPLGSHKLFRKRLKRERTIKGAYGLNWFIL